MNRRSGASRRPASLATVAFGLIRLLRGDRPLLRGDCPIAGETALVLATFLHALQLDSPVQWGHAYFRCPECGRARDCDGEETWDDPHEPPAWCGSERNQGGTGLRLKDLRLSEGWVGRL